MAEEDRSRCHGGVQPRAGDGARRRVVRRRGAFTNFGRDHLTSTATWRSTPRQGPLHPEHSRLGLVNVDDAHGRRLRGTPTSPSAPSPVRSRRRLAGRGRGAHGVRIVVHRGGARRATLPRPVFRWPVTSMWRTRWRRCRRGRGDSMPWRWLDRCGPGPVSPLRLERVDAGQPFEVVVDYAHKPGRRTRRDRGSAPADRRPGHRGDRGGRATGTCAEAAVDGTDRRRSGRRCDRHR